jgi:hypothetical protein
MLNLVVSKIRPLGFERLRGCLYPCWLLAKETFCGWTNVASVETALPSAAAAHCRHLYNSACGSMEGHIKLYWTGMALQCLFNDAVYCADCVAPTTKGWEQRIGGVTLKGDTEMPEKNLYRCHLVRHKCHMHWPAIEIWPPSRRM